MLGYRSVREVVGMRRMIRSPLVIFIVPYDKPQLLIVCPSSVSIATRLSRENRRVVGFGRNPTYVGAGRDFGNKLPFL